MVFTPENIFLLGSALVLVSILISKTGSRFGIPTLLLFLFTGMLFGSDGLGLQFHSPEDAQFIGMISLSVILFTGGMDTKFRDIRPVLQPGVVLSTLGVLLATLITGIFVYYLSRYCGLCKEFSLMVSFLLAATMSSTDSASVFNLLRSQGIGLKYHLRPMLELESGSNDPMAYMLTLAFIQLATSVEGASLSTMATTLLVQFFVGCLLGFILGYIAVWVINHINLPNAALYPVMLLSWVCIIFTITDLLRGNGYLAVYIAGLIVGNSRLSYRREMNTFMNGLTWMVQIILFLTLGLLVNPGDIPSIALVAIIIGLFMIFVSRPLSVFVCLLPFRHLSIKSKVFVSWVGLRGAVPIIFATYPLVSGVEGSKDIFNIVFAITLLSLILQGMSISWFARKLKLDEPEEKDGNEFGIEIPEELGPQLQEITLTEDSLRAGKRLSELKMPKGTLVMMIKRGNSFIVPNGQVELQKDDVLLVITEK